MTSGGSFNFNTFDAVVLGVLGISAIVAFFRGFIRELLSLGAWVGAALVTLYLFPYSTEFMKHHIHGGAQSGSIAAGVGALGTYILALLLFSIINSIILRYVKTGSEVGLLDNFLGLMFGLLRGAFILSLSYLILTAVIPKDSPPDWLKGSVTQPYLQKGGDLLTQAAPHYLNDIEAFVKKEEEKAREQGQDIEDSSQRSFSNMHNSYQDITNGMSNQNNSGVR